MTSRAAATDAFDRIASTLRRRPDIEAHDLVAADASDRLILAEAGDPGDEAVVIGDRYGGIALPLLLARPDASVRVHQDAVTGERALRRNARELGVDLASLTSHELEPALAAGARTVLLQLPRSLDALDEIAALVAAHAAEDVRLVAGGRVKHMSLGMNDVLSRHFREVRASRAAGKSRVLHASGPRRPTGAATSRWPRTVRHDDVGLVVSAHGAAFAGASIDIGTRFLLGELHAAPAVERVVDLGCGTGVLAVSYALAHPRSSIIASDQSSAAVASARATAAANGVDHRVSVVRDDGLGAQPDASADLVLLNPPFHSGAAVTDRIAPRLFADAARVLRPGGELWCVWNSPLAYRPVLERVVGPTRQIARNAKFTVTASSRR